MKKNYLIWIVAAILCLGGAVLFLSSDQETKSRESDSSVVAQDYVPKSTGREVPAGQKEYYNPQYNFSLLYPDTLTAKEFSEAGGAMTVTFEYDDKKTVLGFQIFIVPFAGGQITPERFKQDNPSGVQKNLKEIILEGAVGASFYSKDGVLGDTAEVWFTRGGFLYEVTTFKELDTWLADILATWHFEK